VAEHFEDVIDVLDSIIERVDTFADEAKVRFREFSFL
jgi:hypothetical protein